MITLAMPLFSLSPMSLLLVALLILCGLLTIWLSLIRLKQKSLLRKCVVSVGNLVAVISIAAWLIGINIVEDKILSVVLLTDGAIEVPELNDRQLSIYDMRSESVGRDPVQTRETIGSIAALHQRVPDLQSLHLVGDGLSQQQWLEFKQLYKQPSRINIVFTPGELKTGLVKLDWARQLKLGEHQNLSGELQGADRGKLYSVSAFDPGGEKVATANLRAGEAFSFSFAPKATGQWRYKIQLQEIGEAAILAEESVAFSVEKARQPTILVMQSAPLFETRHLKNWATELGVEMTVVSQISRSRSISQHLNYPSDNQPLHDDPLAQQQLHRYDLMIIDGRALLSLSEDGISYLNDAIEQGLGLLTLADSALLKATKERRLTFNSALVAPALENSKLDRRAVPTWPNSRVRQPMRVFNAQFESQAVTTLIRDENNQPLVVSENRGLGKSSVSLLSNTYQWKTAGLGQTYSHYWQYILSRLGRNTIKQTWQDSQKLEFINQPQRLCFHGDAPPDGELIDTLSQQSQQLKFAAQWLEKDKYCATFWGSNPGWYRVTSDNKDVPDLWLYVYPSSAWRAWQQLDKRTITTANVRFRELQPTSVQTPVSQWWYWLLLLLSMSCLWIERRFFS